MAATSFGSDGVVRLLWENVDGQAALWQLSAVGEFLSLRVYGPF
jgi:hypothetical protein